MVEHPRLQRFVDAQNEGAYQRARAELANGRKTSHWMWFVFPQVAGLGRSATSRQFAVRDLTEARAYLGHDVLGPRLRECVGILLHVQGRSAEQIFGGLDAMKLRSSMTLFARAAPHEPGFAQVLERYFDAIPDAQTDRLLSPGPRGSAGA